MRTFVCRELAALAISTLVALALGNGARAYQLDDHEWITHQAVDELEACFPGLISSDEEQALIRANRSEDTNLLRKWSQYSHFYNPTKEMRYQWRKSSRDRLASLEPIVWALVRDGSAPKGLSHEDEATRFSNELQADLARLMGHLLHHIQDMTCPPHVIPLMHGPRDGFESFRLTAEELPGREDSCLVFDETQARDGALTEILQETASATRAALAVPLAITVGGVTSTIDWSAFWEEIPGPLWGDYGAFGNRFGTVSIGLGPVLYEIPRTSLARFRAAQLRAAIDATKRALLLVYGPLVLPDKLTSDPLVLSH